MPQQTCITHCVSRYTYWHPQSPHRPCLPQNKSTVTHSSRVNRSASGHMAICILGQEICFQRRGDTLSTSTSCSHFFVCILWTVSNNRFAHCVHLSSVLVKICAALKHFCTKKDPSSAYAWTQWLTQNNFKMMFTYGVFVFVYIASQNTSKFILSANTSVVIWSEKKWSKIYASS